MDTERVMGVENSIAGLPPFLADEWCNRSLNAIRYDLAQFRSLSLQIN
jgi:hypothetical protein